MSNPSDLGRRGARAGPTCRLWARGELGATLRGALADVPFRLDTKALNAWDHLNVLHEGGALDCIGALAGTDGLADLDASAKEENLDGLVLRVASVDDLIRMKRAAGQPQDLIAVEWAGRAPR